LNIRRHFPFVWLALALAPIAAQAQNIATVAGGGPNNLIPLSSSIGIPVGIAQDSTGNVYFADPHSNRVYEVSTLGVLTVFAGSGGMGYTGDAGLATAAELSAPTGVFVDSSADVFIADSGNNVIREVTAVNGDITTVAGNGTAGGTGDGGAATSATLNNPSGVYVDASGDIFIADSGNNVIREVVSGTIMRIAGNYGPGGSGGDGGVATSATLNNPLSVYLDSLGNIYIADHNNNKIREVVKSSGDMVTFAGTGVAGVTPTTNPPPFANAAELNGPSSVFVDANNDVFIADTNNNIIWEVLSSNGRIQPVAGNGTRGFVGDGGSAKFAELSLPRDVFVDTTGNIFISDTGNSFIREVGVLSGTIEAFAGNGTLSYSGDGQLAIDASLNTATGVAEDGAGDIFIADSLNNVIREVTASTGIISTVAGSGAAGSTGSGGLAINALLNDPADVFVDGAGDVFIADTGNNVIREVVAVNGSILGASIKTVAGNGSPGNSGDSGFATQAELSAPTSIYVDSQGDIFIADTGNNRVREVLASTGFIVPVVVSTALSAPQGVAVDLFGNIYIADTGNNVIRKVAVGTGTTTIFAGTGAAGSGGDGGPATSAQLNGPTGIVLDASGDLFISDTKNNDVREVLVSSGNIQLVAGNHTAGFSGDGGPALSAALHAPAGLALDGLGGIEIADSANDRIRDVSGLVVVPTAGIQPTTLSFNNQAIGRPSAEQSVTLTNTGTTPLLVANVAVNGANLGSFSQTNNCPNTLQPQGFCTIMVVFTPATSGPLTAYLSITDSAPGSPQSVTLTGIGVSAVSLSPTGLSYPLQINGTSSTVQSITLTNNQSVALNFISTLSQPAISLTGVNATSFSQQNTCGVSLNAGGSCTINVTFTPTLTGSNSASIIIVDDAPGGQQSATLFGLGTGATATFSPATLTFTTQQVTTTSAAQIVTLTNNGKETLNISGIAFTGEGNLYFNTTQTSTSCGPQVLPGANCTISVTFSPLIGGAVTAALTVTDSAGDSPQSLNITGTGIDFQISVPTGGSASATVTAGTPANYQIQITAIGGILATDSIKVALTCGGVPQGAVCTISSNTVTVTPNTAAVVNVTVTTTASTEIPPGGWPGLGPQWGRRPLLVFYILVILTLMAFLVGRRIRPAAFRRLYVSWCAAALLAGLLITSAGLLTSCGSGQVSTTTGASGVTSSATYNMNVSGTSGNDSHTFNLLLTVQ
jgi:protein gp37